MLKNKKRTMRVISFFVLVIVLLLMLKCCSDSNTKEEIDNSLEYIEFAQSQIDESDNVLTKLEKWLSEMDLELICTPEIGKGFKSYGNQLKDLASKYDSKVYIGEEAIPLFNEYARYFVSIDQMGQKMIDISSAINEGDNDKVLKLFDELIEIHKDIKEIRGIVNG